MRFGAPLCALGLLVGVALMPRVEIKPRMKVALSVWPGSEALVLGRDSGLIASERIRVIELPWASAATRTFDDNVVDVAVLTLDGILQMLESGHKLRVIQVLDQSTGGDAVIARPEFTSMASLKHKRLGVDVYGSGMYLLVSALEKAGMSLKDIEIVPLIQPEIESMFQDGSIDAAVAGDPWLTQIRGQGMRVMYDSKEQDPPIYRFLVASEKACTQFKPELQTLIRTITSLERTIRSGQSFDGMESIIRREKVTFADFVKNLNHWQPVTQQQNLELLSGATPGLNAVAQKMAKQMLRHDLLRSIPPLANWLDPQFVKTSWDG